MNELQIFNYHDKEIRTVEKDGEIWWVLKDVCAAFGVTSYRDVAARLDDDEKGVGEIATPGGMQKLTIVNQSGLYSALFTMQPYKARGVPDELIEERKQQLKDFKRWVTHEVLPSIQRTGSYDMGQSQPLTPAQLLAAQAQVLVDMEQRMNQMQGQTRALEAKVETAIRAFSRPDKDHWKEDLDKAIKEVCELYGSSIVKLKGQLYAELEQKANCNINSRLAALRRRSKKAGMRCADAMALTKLDAIAADKKLRAIFEGIVRSWQATSIPVSGTLEVEGEARHEG